MKQIVWVSTPSHILLVSRGWLNTYPPHTHNNSQMQNLKIQIIQTNSLTIHSLTHPFGSERVAEYLSPPSHCHNTFVTNQTFKNIVLLSIPSHTLLVPRRWPNTYPPTLTIYQKCEIKLFKDIVLLTTPSHTFSVPRWSPNTYPPHTHNILEMENWTSNFIKHIEESNLQAVLRGPNPNTLGALPRTNQRPSL